ncbi:MAG: single-stranded DNA-binding protein [Candidatus Kaiserbacteria bacterium]|nr:single-stranded DNA-binding protein [Candidatus Kaiserbacteria bacterium]
MFINKAFIYGNLTRDPEIRQLPSGANVANVGVATNRFYNNQQGERVEEAEFHNVVFFGRLADLVQQYLKKGSGVFVEGRLRTSSWEADGVTKYRTEIIGEQMQFGPRSAGAPEGGSPAPRPAKTAPAPEKAPEYPEVTINPDDIPF